MTPKEVAQAIMDQPTEVRGNFLRDVSEELKRRGQGYTGKLMAMVASAYNGGKEVNNG